VLTYRLLTISQNDRDLCTRSSNIAARVAGAARAASVVTYLSARVARVAPESSAEPTRARPRQKE
jgi:hypothetical protein